jgi:hypothetical protein
MYSGNWDADEYGIIRKVRGAIELLSRQFPAGTDENHENPES